MTIEFTRLELEYIYYAVISVNYRDRNKHLLPKHLQKVLIDFAYENTITDKEVSEIVNNIRSKVGNYLD